MNKIRMTQNTFFEVAASAVQAQSRIRHHIYQTPILPSRITGKNEGANVFFKAENFQLTGSFKLRGAMSKLTAQGSDQRSITASSGNHGIGAAYASQVLSKDLIVVLPSFRQNWKKLSLMAWT
jgi:threonine dehydratase